MNTEETNDDSRKYSVSASRKKYWNDFVARKKAEEESEIAYRKALKNGTVPPLRGRHAANAEEIEYLEAIALQKKKDSWRKTPESYREGRKTVRYSFCVLIVVLIFYVLFLIRLTLLPDLVSADDSFLNPYEITGGAAVFHMLISLTWGAILIGWYLMMKIDIYPKIMATILLILFGISYLTNMAITDSVADPVSTKMLITQHEWAEDRYGITYDSITFYKTSGKYQATLQHRVISDGRTIAEVCGRNSWQVYFCKPGTDEELDITTPS